MRKRDMSKCPAKGGACACLGYCWVESWVDAKPAIMREQGLKYPAMFPELPQRPAQGWQCPVCKAVYAPTMPFCTNCNGKNPTTNKD